MHRLVRFAAAFVGSSLFLAGVLLALPGAGGWMQSYEHVAAHDSFPDDNPPLADYDGLSADQQRIVDAAIDGRTVTQPYGDGLPPTWVARDGRYHEFAASKWFALHTRTAQIAVTLLLVGGALAGWSIRQDMRQ